MQGQLPTYTVATACYGKEPKSTSTMYFIKKLRINLLFPDVRKWQINGAQPVEKLNFRSIEVLRWIIA